MPTHTLTVTSRYDDGSTVSTKTHSYTKTSDGYSLVEVAVPDSSTDLEIEFSCDVSALKLFQMTADGVILVETNSGSTPDDTFSLTATEHVNWADGQNGSEDVCPISADITSSVFATNSSGATVNLAIRSLEDITP